MRMRSSGVLFVMCDTLADVSYSGWPRHDDNEQAVDNILDAAGRAFARHGVAKATMVDVASEAGCSRATLYRYFPNREALREAFVHRGTLRMAKAMARRRATGVPHNAADRILAGIAAVRDDPQLAAWFEPENIAVPLQVSKNSELLRTLAVTLLDDPTDPSVDRSDLQLRGDWLLRSIISLLAMPAADSVHERALVEDILLPALAGRLTQ